MLYLSIALAALRRKKWESSHPVINPKVAGQHTKGAKQLKMQKAPKTQTLENTIHPSTLFTEGTFGEALNLDPII